MFWCSVLQVPKIWFPENNQKHSLKTHIVCCIPIFGSFLAQFLSFFSPMAELKVAIIGGGLGGLTLAKTLLRRGGHGGRPVAVRIYEAWDHWKVRGGGLGMAAGGRILRELGLEEGLKAVANQIDAMQWGDDCSRITWRLKG